MSIFTKAVDYVAARSLSLIEPRLQQWFAGGLGTTTTLPGRSVTGEASLQIDTVFACVRLIAQTIGTLPVVVRRRRGDDWATAYDHPLYVLLHDAPNADMAASELLTALAMQLKLWGNAFAEITRLMGRIVAITPLRSACMRVERLGDGALVYVYDDPAGGRERRISEADVIHIKGPSLDGVWGLSPIAQARHTLGLAAAAEQTQSALFANGMKATGYLRAPAYLTKEQRKDAERMLLDYSGAQNAGRTPLLEGGWEFKQIALPPAEAELLATRSFSVETICRWFAVPPHLVGHMQKSTSWGTGLEEQTNGFHKFTLRPDIKAIEGALKRRLLRPEERGQIDIELSVEGLLRADSQGRANYLKTMVEAGIYSRNEARAYEGKGPKPGGDDLTVQSNQLPLGRLGEATTRADLTRSNADA